MKGFSWGMAAALFICGCGSKGEIQQAGANPSASAAAPAANIRKRTPTDPSTAIPQKGLGKGEVRVALLVLPVDAPVEVDKVRARRRNGMVELVGSVGDERRVEVFLDEATKVARTVKIEAAGVSPPLIDAGEESKVKTGPVKTPALFDNDE